MFRAKASLLLAGFVVIAFASSAQAQAPKALEGTWTLDPAKSSFSPGPAPKALKVTYSSVAPNGVKIVVEMTPVTGAPQKWEMSVQYDGKEYPVTGNPNADVVTAKKVDDSTGESTFKKGGAVTATNVRKISADGKTLTVTSTGTTVDGKPRKDVQVFHK